MTRKSPGLNRNAGSGNLPNLPSPDAVRKALAFEILDKERIAEAGEVRKRHRKKAELDGIILEDLDTAYKMKDMGLSEIEAWMRRKFNVLSAVVVELGTQFELFTASKSARDKFAVHRQAGMTAGLHGKKASPPPGLAAEETNQWMAGHDEGAKARMDAIAEQMAEADAAAEARKAELEKQAKPEEQEDDTSDRDPEDQK